MRLRLVKGGEMDIGWVMSFVLGKRADIQGSEKSRGQLEIHVNLYNFISSGRRGAPLLRLVWHERQHGSAPAIKSNYVISREILVVRDFFRYPVQ